MSRLTRLGRRWQALAPALVCALLWGLPAHGAPPPGTHGAQPREGVALLDAYLDGLSTLRVNFVQTVADSQGKEIDRATGTLIVVRPGKLRWEIHPPKSAAGSSGGELIVADGRNVWHLDRDLDQVTVRPADEALSATPTMLLSGTVDLHKSFNVSPAGMREGLEWVMVEPKAAQAEFRSALFGFDHQDLSRLILENKLGQVATVYFDQVKRNGPVSPGEVSFTPPPGTDVIGKPR
jgi:outer membrane lipoprotein carrier protein